MRNRTLFSIAVFSGLLTATLIFLIRFVDVAAIGPEATTIGLSHMNQFFFQLFGVNMTWYKISNLVSIAAYCIAGLFALAGVFQWFKRKNLLKVDGEILALGILYIAVAGVYILFESVIVNYRPIIMPGEGSPEVSFPSSHTMVVCVILVSAMILSEKYIRNRALCKLLRMVGLLIFGIVVIGRTLSGVHWFTDILGGILISAGLLALFAVLQRQMASRHSPD